MLAIRYKIIAALAAAGIGPYVATETEMGQSAMQSVNGLFAEGVPVEVKPQDSLAHGIPSNEEQRERGYANTSLYEIEKLREVRHKEYRYDSDLAQKLGAISENPNQQPTLSGHQVEDIGQLLRFDISPHWVISQFSRVSTVLANLNLKGLRVPIVTGIRADDLAGTLTYYFDSSDHLQRVTFHGFTGDPTKLERLMVSGYGLQREPALEAGAFTKRWNGRPTHFFRLTHAPVVFSDAVHHKYTVFFELNHPDLPYGISAEARKIVETDHHTGRW
ncbi:DUF6690 family protein [Rhodopirellula sp. MGV]|uniref:DUF6690 family protein n=1 Tax=Rhodopirellula sp. MGV TaxID=2023130 RepID=UPI000B9770DF|nr:DUF6690 family protein [Rhodopirellula sp. MGV]OYP37706.1 hypothetical protein CGZ80_04265 [Rhodopirellula sp. MGV]PNY37144.1 hypothetical protein C2E31_09120 [Rhodopirellula baltica]